MRPGKGLAGVSARLYYRDVAGEHEVSVPFVPPPPGFHLASAPTRQAWLEDAYGEHVPALATVARVELGLDGRPPPRGWRPGQDRASGCSCGCGRAGRGCSRSGVGARRRCSRASSI